MCISLQKLTQYLQQFPLAEGEGDAHTFMELLYLSYLGRAGSDGSRIQNCFRLLDGYTGHLPFAQRDEICSALLSLCAEYERTAFLDGLRTGAQLVLELTE